MKRFPIVIAVALPAFLAAASFAQIVPVRVSVPVNPVAGLPKLLPSPLSGPLTGMGISLPSPVPTLAPSPALLSAAVAPAPIPARSLPAVLPTRAPGLPVPANPSHENVNNPLRKIMPGVVVRFADNAPKGEKAAPGGKNEALDELFDGDGQPLKPGMNRGAISHERRISLPEDDLMKELGF